MNLLDKLDNNFRFELENLVVVYRIRNAFRRTCGLQERSQHSLTERESAIWLATDGTQACGEEGLFRSTDRGAHWRLVNPKGPRGYGTAVTEDRDGRVYAGLARGRPNTWIRSEGADAAIVRSEDGGQTWQPVVEGLRGGVLDLCTAAEGDSVFAVTSDGDLLEVSLDGCRTVASRLPCISALTAA